MAGKMKTFLTAIPFQPKGKLEAVSYKPVECEELAYGKTRFPIITAIAHHAKGEEAIRVIAIVTEGENFKYNYETYFLPEIEALCAQMNVKPEITTVLSPDSEKIDVHLKLFADLVAEIRDNEELYACITFGTKPTPIVLSLALSYAYRLKKGTSVERVIYGKFFHEEKQSYLYDTTPLFYMNSIVHRLSEVKAHDPEKAIRILLGLDAAEAREDEH